MSDSESSGSDLEVELTDPTCSQEESDEEISSSSSESESSGSDEDEETPPTKPVLAKKRITPPQLKPQATQVLEIEDESEDEENEAPAEEEEDFQPSLEEQHERRQENIRAMISGSLEIHRKPLLPKLLTVQDAAVVLKKPFKSPHPNAPARSEALKRALVARKQFVPWGAVGKAFQPPIKLLPHHVDEPDTPAAPPVELPAGIDPLVLWEPPPDTEGNPVKVDDALTRFLRPHQREGVQFMFECVAGLRNFDGKGCILADDMGLGKTLQGITLLWTLLNNGHELLGGEPLARRIIICCPTSLVSNWDSECTKWLNGRVRTLPLCESSREDVISTINQFLSPRNPAQLLIVSYETFRLHAERFKSPEACDLLICDEAHRLKNDQTLTNKALDSLACRRRVLLSGTPMQNQLQEFYAMVNFCNPGVLGTPSQFRKHYESPILAGREPDASDSEAALGAERSAELSEIVNEFILRRTNSLLSAHLPPKVVEVVCCKMTPLQYDLYVHFVQSRSVQNLFATQKSARALSAITSLRKLLNHPKLIYDMVHSSTSSRANSSEGSANGFEDCGKLFPPGLFDAGRGGRGGAAVAGALPVGWEAMSGKFAVVARMLAILREQTKDRIVIVSNYTQTLDLFTNLCRERGYPVLRLDGSTSISKRQKLVKKFNDPLDNQYVFLLSSKAGGCGLNLVGGNRLILFDMSWNPADDKQAAARVWRDGQRRRVYVYRFMTTGTIEEKVYQRQLSKEGLQAVVDAKGSGGGGGGAAVMSLEELRDLFSYDPDTLSTTYDHMVAAKGLPKKKRPEKVKKGKAAGKKGGHGKGKAVVEDSEDEVVLDSSDDEEENENKENGRIIEDSEEEDEEEEVEEELAVEAPVAGNGKAPPLLSAALAKSAGGIYKDQDGTPKEEDLAAWGHHSDPRTVPDACMQLTGGEDVTFVFSCQVDGRDVPPDPPLAPLGQGKAAGAPGHGAPGMRSVTIGGALGRPSSMPPVASKVATAAVEAENVGKNGGAPRSNPPPAAKKITPVPAAPKSAAPAVGKGATQKRSPPSRQALEAAKGSEPVPTSSKSAPGKVAGTKRPSPSSQAPPPGTALPGPKSQPPPRKSTGAGAVAAKGPPGSAVATKRRSSAHGAPQTAAAAPGPGKRMAILYDSDDDFVSH